MHIQNVCTLLACQQNLMEIYWFVALGLLQIQINFDMVVPIFQDYGLIVGDFYAFQLKPFTL